MEMRKTLKDTRFSGCLIPSLQRMPLFLIKIPHHIFILFHSWFGVYNIRIKIMKKGQGIQGGYKSISIKWMDIEH